MILEEPIEEDPKGDEEGKPEEGEGEVKEGEDENNEERPELEKEDTEVSNVILLCLYMSVKLQQHLVSFRLNRMHLHCDITSFCFGQRHGQERASLTFDLTL